jgi:hypothetical protein
VHDGVEQELPVAELVSGPEPGKVYPASPERMASTLRSVARFYVRLNEDGDIPYEYVVWLSDY